MTEPDPDLPLRDPEPPALPGPEQVGATPVVRISQRNIWIAVSAGAGLLLTGVLLVVLVLPRVLSTPAGSDRAPDAPPAAAPSDARRIQATMFFVAENGQELVPVSRSVLYGATPLEQARRLVEALVEPPPEGQRSAIPEGTTVRSVFLAADGNVFVDFGGPIVTGHPGGSLNEALTVYAIVNAVTANLPDVAAVQILVEGRQVDTLAGHVDLRYPLGKALEWVRKGQ
jgi:spore germination protein GerM